MITKYENFRRMIQQAIQNSGLDIGIVYFIFKDIFSEIEKLYYAYLNTESAEKTQLNTDFKDTESEHINAKAEE